GSMHPSGASSPARSRGPAREGVAPTALKPTSDGGGEARWRAWWTGASRDPRDDPSGGGSRRERRTSEDGAATRLDLVAPDWRGSSRPHALPPWLQDRAQGSGGDGAGGEGRRRQMRGRGVTGTVEPTRRDSGDDGVGDQEVISHKL
ncbi:unnamed protein product, partial [Urochloa humidicola]